MLAAFLLPAIKNSDSDTLLDAQEKIFAFGNGEKEALKEIFTLEHEMTRKLTYADSYELTKHKRFNEAYMLLKMRAVTDKTLFEILNFWEQIITDVELREAA